MSKRRTRAVVMAVALCWLSGCGGPPTEEEMRAADGVLVGLAACMDRVSEGISTGSFRPQYTDCINEHLTPEAWAKLREGGPTLSPDFRSFMSEREDEMQAAIDRATAAAGNSDEQQAALLAYQLLLGATAVDLRVFRSSGGA